MLLKPILFCFLGAPISFSPACIVIVNQVRLPYLQKVGVIWKIHCKKMKELNDLNNFKV